MKKKKTRYTLAGLTAEVLTLKAQMKTQISVNAEVRGKLAALERCLKLETDNRRGEIAYKEGELCALQQRILALESRPAHAKCAEEICVIQDRLDKLEGKALPQPTPPPAPEGYEMTEEYRIPVAGEIFIGYPGGGACIYSGDYVWPRTSPRWILRKVEQRKISIVFTAAEWNDISVELRKSGMSAESAHIQNQLEAAKH